MTAHRAHSRVSFRQTITSSRSSGVLVFLVVSVLLASGLIFKRVAACAAGASQKQKRTSTALQGKKAIDQLKEQGLYSSLQEAMTASRYKAEWQAQTTLAGLESAYELKNHAHNLRAYLTSNELRVLSLSDEAQRPWQFGMKLIGYGYGDSLSSIATGEITAKENRVEIQKSAIDSQQSPIIEWYVNTERGIEQGFDIAAAPAGKPKGEPLRLTLELSGSLKARLDESKQAMTLSECSTSLVYGGLEALDARGRSLASHMELQSDRLTLVVDDTGAAYPVKIDPLLTQIVKLTASDGAPNDQFGRSVAISGDTVVVGAFKDDVGVNANQGSAYVFVQTGAVWVLQKTLTASDGAAGDAFGISVAISGDTVIVGSYFDTVGAPAQGSAYVFVRSGITWTQQQKLTASDGGDDDQFGISVAISGDTVVVGAYLDEIGFTDQGSAYVFVRSGTTWTQLQKLIASDGAASDVFGYSVAINGDSLVVGAYLDNIGFTDQGSAYVFVRSGTTWTLQQKLTASDAEAGDRFGESVAISEDTVVAGASHHGNIFPFREVGSAYVYIRSGNTWTEQKKLTASDGAEFDRFGNSVAISGETVVVGAFTDSVGLNHNQGSGYVFVRSGSSWSQQQSLIASDGRSFDQFGQSVAISGDTVVVGAPFEQGISIPYAGSAYIFSCGRTNHTQLIADDGAASDNFGQSVAISGDTVVVGAPLDDLPGGADQGSAYVFIRSGTAWALQQQLTASDAASSDNFGNSVAISGDTVVVGASLDNLGTGSDQGSAYVFVRSGTTWAEQQRLTASDRANDDHFGQSVAISGDTIVVGANQDDVGGHPDQGSAYIFVRSFSIWMEEEHLTVEDGASDDHFGLAVAISGDTVVVGAPFDDVFGVPDQGSAYVFVRFHTTWTQQQKLYDINGTTGDLFGWSVAISGNTVVVGAFQHAVAGQIDQGSAYVFVRNGSDWSPPQQLTASDGAAGDQFGFSVAISVNTVVVGAPHHVIGVNADQGSAYVFIPFNGTWQQQQQLIAPDGSAGDQFGNAVGTNGETVVVGALLNDALGNPATVVDQGSAYVFFSGCNTAPAIAAAAGFTRQQGSPATLATLATVSDFQDPAGSLTVTATSIPSGITLSGLTNNNGAITAIVAAGCNAQPGSQGIILQVADGSGSTSTANVEVIVTFDTNPVVGNYADTSVAASGSTSVTSIAPSDNGSIIEFTATSPTFNGGLGANRSSGVVTINNARPAGTHVITVTAIDNCGNSQSSAFLLTVTCSNITVNPPTIAGATAGSAYSQTFTQTGGLGTATFSLIGMLPTGLSFNSGTATLSGTPTQIGSFPFTVAATDAYSCSGSRNYTLTIAAPMLVWNGSTSSDWHTPSNWTPNQTPTTYHDVSIPASGVVNQPIIGNFSSAINAMTLQTGRVLTINSSRQLTTAGNITSAGQITGAGSLQFDGGTFTQNGSVSLASVEFKAGFHGLAGGGAFASGIITVLNGANVALTSNHSVSVVVINSGGSLDISNRTLTLTGAGTAVFNSGAVTATGSTIIYQGSISQVVAANINYNNLTINNAAGVFLSGDTTVNGLLNLATDLTTSSFILTMPAGGTSTGSGDVIGNVKRTGFTMGGAALSFGNALNTIQINSGTAPTDITMNMVKLPPFGFSNCVSRTYSITANGGSGISATMRLRYRDTEATGLDESSFELWRYEAPNWLSPSGAATRDTAQNWLQETGIAQFSQWTIAGGSGPSCGVLTPNSQFFTVAGAEGSVVVTALASCPWAASSNASWLEITSSPSGAGSEVVTYIVRDNFAPVPRQGTLTIAGLTFTVVQDSEAATDCVFNISTAFAAFNASGGTGSLDVITEERCAWNGVSNVSWITITSISCGIGNGTITYSVGANPSPSGRSGTITLGGKVFAIKQKGQ